MRTNETIRDVAPFVLWMALMSFLPAAPWSYALRAAVTFGAMLALGSLKGVFAGRGETIRALAWGIPVGFLVLAIWVLPEANAWYCRYCMYGYTANAPVDTSAWYWQATRLIGSAFVISAAEELFFRRFLMRYAGFLWMVALFALEHNRWLVGAIAGALYGWLMLKKGLASAIVAHAVTNLALGLYVLKTGNWAFW